MLPLGNRMTDLPHLRAPLDLSGDLDLLSILVVSPFGSGDGTVRVGNLAGGGKGDAWIAIRERRAISRGRRQ